MERTLKNLEMDDHPQNAFLLQRVSKWQCNMASLSVDVKDRQCFDGNLSLFAGLGAPKDAIYETRTRSGLLQTMDDVYFLPVNGRINSVYNRGHVNRVDCDCNIFLVTFVFVTILGRAQAHGSPNEGPIDRQYVGATSLHHK